MTIDNEAKTEEAEGESVEISKAYVMGDGRILSSEDMVQEQAMKKSPSPQDTDDSQKPVQIGDIVDPPYDAVKLAKFLEMDETHQRCVNTKVADSVGRNMSLVRREDSRKETASDEQIRKEKEEVEDFIEEANEYDEFSGVLEKAATDYESVGWGAIEVIRSFDKKIKKINHVPASRVRVLKGWKGFAEISDNGRNNKYFLPFGAKLLSPNREDLSGNSVRYNPKKDGAIQNAEWNLVSKEDLSTRVPINDIKNSANEMLFISKVHPKSVYYGVPDFIPALGSMVGNKNIEDFFLQFFEHNTVPQYAVVVKGASLSPDVRETIRRYFQEEIKGEAHKTLYIPIPSAAGDAEVKFERLSADTKEGSFQDTRKNNAESIIVAHGMSPAVVGIVESANLGSGKGTAQQENYKNRVVRPLQERWENVLSKFFRLGLGVMNVTPTFEELDPVDMQTQRENLLAYLDRGVLSINEVRERAKLGPPIEGGDRPFVMKGGVPVFIDTLEDAEKVPQEQNDEEMKNLKEMVDRVQVD